MSMETESDDTASEFTPEQLDEMLEAFVEAKKIEADPKKLAALRDYADQKHQEVKSLFDGKETTAPKSLKDLKKTYADKVASEEPDEGDL